MDFKLSQFDQKIVEIDVELQMQINIKTLDTKTS